MSGMTFEIYCDKRSYVPREEDPASDFHEGDEGYIFWLVDDRYKEEFAREALSVANRTVLKDTENFECFTEEDNYLYSTPVHHKDRRVAIHLIDAATYTPPYIEIPSDGRPITDMTDLTGVTDIQIVRRDKGVFLSASALLTVSRDISLLKPKSQKVKTIHSSTPRNPPEFSSGVTVVKLLVPLITKMDDYDVSNDIGSWFEEGTIRIYFPGSLEVS